MRIVIAVALLVGCTATVEGTGAPSPAPPSSSPGEPEGPAPAPTASAPSPGPIVVPQPPTPDTARFVAICKTALAAFDEKQALRFVVTLRKDGGMTLVPLRGWDERAKSYYIPQTSDETVGAPVQTTWSENGATLAAIDLPAAANSISGRAARIENVALKGPMKLDQGFVTTFEGQMISPYQYAFRPENTCRFER